MALISQEMFQLYSGVLAAMPKCTGFLVFTHNPDLGVTQPPAGSPDNPIPNHRHGLPFTTLGTQKFNNDSYVLPACLSGPRACLPACLPVRFSVCSRPACFLQVVASLTPRSPVCPPRLLPYLHTGANTPEPPP